MPVKLWEHRNGVLSNSVVVGGMSKGSPEGERRRPEAEALDAEEDAMLDKAVSLYQIAKAEQARRSIAPRWALGRAIHESGLLNSPNLDTREYPMLWLAIDRKCRHGIRADGSYEDAWRVLVPSKERDAERPDRDPFPVSLWLQEQDLEGTVDAFGGKYGNAQKLFMRTALRSLNLREALAKWMRCQPADVRAHLTNNKRFWGVIKALRARFPDRGPGSALRPVHYGSEELFSEVCKVLDPLAAEVERVETPSLPL